MAFPPQQSSAFFIRTNRGDSHPRPILPACRWWVAGGWLGTIGQGPLHLWDGGGLARPAAPGLPVARLARPFGPTTRARHPREAPVSRFLLRLRGFPRGRYPFPAVSAFLPLGRARRKGPRGIFPGFFVIHRDGHSYPHLNAVYPPPYSQPIHRSPSLTSVARHQIRGSRGRLGGRTGGRGPGSGEACLACREGAGHIGSERAVFPVILSGFVLSFGSYVAPAHAGGGTCGRFAGLGEQERLM